VPDTTSGVLLRYDRVLKDAKGLLENAGSAKLRWPTLCACICKPATSAAGRREPGSAQKLIDESLSQSNICVVAPAEIDLGKYIFVALNLAVRVNVDHGAIHLE
jgi:hypothetical protein